MTSQSAFSFPYPTSFSTQQATFTSFSPGQTYVTSEPVTNSQPNPQTSNNFQNQQFQQYHTATLSSNNAKFSYLKNEEYETETKAKTLLLQSLLEDHMADFHHLDDVKEIWLAVKARFGGNEESKKIRKTMHEAENKTEEGEKVYGLMAGFKSDFTDHAGNAAGSVSDAATEFAMMGISSKAKIEKKEWEVKLVESLARFDKWKESSKNPVKLINSSMSSRTKLGLGFKEAIGSDEVFDLSTPSVFDPEPENREVKSLYERFVKAGKMREVPPPITGTFMPTSYKSDLEETQETFGSKSNTSSINTSESNDFVSCDNSDKSSESETFDFASCVSRPKTNDSSSTIDVKILPKSDVKDPSAPMASYISADSRNSSASISAGRSIPAASRNRPAYIHAGRRIPAGRFNKPAPFPGGRSVPTGWTNHAARLFFRPTNLYFDNVFWPGIYDHMSMNEGRWGSVVKSSAELASPEKTATCKDVSNPFMAVMVCQKPLGYFSSPMIHVSRAGLVIHPPG
nr:xylulose kinase-1 [Tanacetum cinerariifolium]